MEKNKLKKMSNKNVNVLIMGNITSRLGNIIFDYCNSVIITKLFPKNPIYMGVYQGSESIISILFNLFGGGVADSYNRKRLLIYTDLFSAMVCIICMFFLNTNAVLYAIIIANIILSIISSMNYPIYSSIVKDCIIDKDFQKYNSILSASKQVINITGPILAIIIWRYFSIMGAYIFNSISFLASAAIEVKIYNIYSYSKKKRVDIIKKIMEGLVYIKKHKVIIKLLVLSSVINFFFSGYNLILPYTNNIFCKYIDNFYSKAIIAQSLGGIFGSILNIKCNLIRNKEKAMLVYILNCGVALLIFPYISIFTKNMILNLIPICMFGFFLTLYNITFFVSVQKMVDREYLGRVSSIISTTAIILMPVGSMFFSRILNVNRLLSISIMGFSIIIVAITYFLYNYYLDKKLDK